jgi:hypothetical protein
MSLFKTGFAKTPCGGLTLADLVAGIREGRWKAEVERCRSFLASGDLVGYESAKRELPAVMLSARVKHRRKGTSPEQREAVHNGCLQIDLDGKDNPGRDLGEIGEVLKSIPWIVAVFISPSGNGVKAIARCPADFDNHAGSWHAAASELERHALKIDPSTKDSGRLCFVSYDPEAWQREGEAAEIVPVDIPEPAARGGSSGGTEDPEHVERVIAELSAKIGPHQNRTTWLHILAATKDAVGDDTAAEIVDRYFPPFDESHDTAARTVRTLHSGTWRSLLKHGIDPIDHVKDMADCTAEDGEPVGASEPPAAPTLRERAYALRFNPDETPPPDEVCLVIGDIPIASRGNLTGIQGKSKVGKSSVISAIIGAAHRGIYVTTGDTFCIEWEDEAKGAIIHLDTEQSRADWHALVSRAITRSGIPDMSERLVSLPLVMFARSERLEILHQSLRFERDRLGAVDLVVIDGVADLCASPNDEGEALELISQLMALAQEFNAAVFCVLHENPSSEANNPKTRGHLGSELNRKAFANLRIDKDGETSVSTIYGTDMRKREIPKDHGFCFAWDDAAGMHTFQGRADGVKAAKRQSDAIEKARSEWSRIYEIAAENGTNGACPELNPQQAAEIERDMNGTNKAVGFEAMKKRMQRAEAFGVLRKTARGEWTLNQTGQTGHERDKL